MLDVDAVALVVNAGGASRRMGRVKALLPMPPDDTPLIVAIIRRLSPLVTDRVVVVSQDAATVAAVDKLPNTVVVADQWPDGGALGGITTGLGACAAWAMVVACDMPLVSASIFARLLRVAHAQPTFAAVIPVVGGQAQPFHGVWHRRAVPALAAQLAKGELRVQRALEELDVCWLDETALGIAPDDVAFRNVNTPAEWADFLSILGEKRA